MVVQTITGGLTNISLQDNLYQITLTSLLGEEETHLTIPKEYTTIKKQDCIEKDCDILASYFVQPALVAEPISLHNDFDELNTISWDEIDTNKHNIAYLIISKEITKTKITNADYQLILREASL